MIRIALLSLALLTLSVASEAHGQQLLPAAFVDQRGGTHSLAAMNLPQVQETTSKGQWVAIGVVLGAVAGGATLGILVADRLRNCDGCVAGDLYLAGAISIGVVGGGAVGGIVAALLHSTVAQRGAR